MAKTHSESDRRIELHAAHSAKEAIDIDTLYFSPSPKQMTGNLETGEKITLQNGSYLPAYKYNPATRTIDTLAPHQLAPDDEYTVVQKGTVDVLFARKGTYLIATEPVKNMVVLCRKKGLYEYWYAFKLDIYP